MSDESTGEIRETLARYLGSIYHSSSDGMTGHPRTQCSPEWCGRESKAYPWEARHRTVNDGVEDLDLIARIVTINAEAQNDEDGGGHLADPQYALEAIENILGGTMSGALRMYLEAM